MGIFLFFLLATVCVAAVVGMILSRNQAYSALFLVLVFAALGGLFGLLDAPFIAAVQIIIYAGAIMVLFIFVIMMINLEQGIPPERKKWAARSCGSVLAVVLARGAACWPSGGRFCALGRTGRPADRQAPTELGRLLFTEYLYPFEITSILIIAALVGAIVLAKKERRQNDPGRLVLRPEHRPLRPGDRRLFRQARPDHHVHGGRGHAERRQPGLHRPGPGRPARRRGQVIVFFVITVAAAEAAVGLAIILLVFRQKKSIKAEDMNLMKG